MSKKRHDRADEADTVLEPAATDTPLDAVPADDDPGDEITQLRDQIADLHVQIANLQSEVAEQVDRRLRTAAELDNVRKRGRREVDDARRFAQADLLRSLLEVLDNFDRALQYTPDGPAADDAAGEDSYRQGVELIAQRFRQVLVDRGVRRIETEGQPFDPALHEAVGQAPAPAGAESGAIVAEVQSGYTFDDLVLRASRVIVAQ